MKTKSLILAATLSVLSFCAFGADTYNVNNLANPVVNTATVTNDLVLSNGVYVVVSSGTSKGYGGFWTNSIIGSTTNLTLLNTSTGLKDMALEFESQITATNLYPVSVVYQLARNISGGSTTNGSGSPLNLELFAQVTNTIPINATTTRPTVVNITSAPTTPANVLVQTSFSNGAIPNFYLYSISLYTNGVAINNVAGTNCQVYVNTD